MIPPRPPTDESAEARAARIRALAQLVQSGRYEVRPDRLAHALLHAEPARVTSPLMIEAQSTDRRAYMREYMRQRRAQADALSG